MTFKTRTTYTKKPVRLAIRLWGVADQCIMLSNQYSLLLTRSATLLGWTWDLKKGHLEIFDRTLHKKHIIQYNT